MRFMKPTAAALALVVASLSLSGTADARDRYYRHHHHDNNALAAGIFGFAAGAILSGALAQPRYYSCGPGYIYDPHYGCVAPIYGAPPPPVVYQPAYQPEEAYQPAQVYYDHPEPWTPEWRAYCNDRYQSFSDRTGYFLGFDGQYHFCR